MCKRQQNTTRKPTHTTMQQAPRTPSKSGKQGQGLLSPSRTGSQRDPSISGSQKDPSISGSQKDPSISGSQRDPSISGSHKDPSISGSQKVPSYNGSQKVPSITGSQRVPSITSAHSQQPSAKGSKEHPPKLSSRNLEAPEPVLSASGPPPPSPKSPSKLLLQGMKSTSNVTFVVPSLDKTVSSVASSKPPSEKVPDTPSASKMPKP